MFSKISRYRKLPDEVTIDPHGRELTSKNLRLLPEVPSRFRHTVEEVDRLDHLSFKFYKQPRNWWRICDANPEFLLPQELLGKEPLITQRFPVNYEGPETTPPWAVLLTQLSESVGVEDVRVEEEIELISEIQEINGEKREVIIEQRFHRAVMIAYNQMNIGLAELSELIVNSGFEVSEPQNVGRVGKQMVIPPPVIG
jgi:hypothetical protein